MPNSSQNWRMDPRLEQDTLPLASLDQAEIRLMNDSRWPWIIIVPIVDEATEIEDLLRDDLQILVDQLAGISRALKAAGLAQSTNVASLGNIVTQLHWHVVGRREGDPNWPGPVWGFGKPEPYSPQAAKELIAAFQKSWREDRTSPDHL